MDMQPVSRILGLDYGRRRIGVAKSDPLCITAQPDGVIDNSDGGWKKLLAMVEKERPRLIVVGLPLNLKGESGPAGIEATGFMERLGAATGIEVIAWDERFTTAIAQRSLRAMTTKRSHRQARDGRLDAMAAALILQSYLDSTKHSRSC